MEINSSRDPSPVESSNSSLVNLDSRQHQTKTVWRRGNLQGGLRSGKTQESWKKQWPHSKLNWNLHAQPHRKLWHLMPLLNWSKEQFPQKYWYLRTLLKRGEGECSGLFEPHTEPMSQLPRHKKTVRAFELLAAEVLHPSFQPKRDQTIFLEGKLPKSRKILPDQMYLFQT